MKLISHISPIVLLVLSPLFFLISLVSVLMAKAVENGAYSAYQATDFDSEKYDAIQQTYMQASEATSMWGDLTLLAILAVLLTLVVFSLLARTKTV